MGRGGAWGEASRLGERGRGRRAERVVADSHVCVRREALAEQSFRSLRQSTRTRQEVQAPARSFTRMFSHASARSLPPHRRCILILPVRLACELCPVSVTSPHPRRPTRRSTHLGRSTHMHRQFRGPTRTPHTVTHNPNVHSHTTHDTPSIIHTYTYTDPKTSRAPTILFVAGAVRAQARRSHKRRSVGICSSRETRRERD